MVKYCAVPVCRNGTHNRPDLTFFAFPKDHCRRRKWVIFCKRVDKKFKNLVDPRIYSLHFEETDVKVLWTLICYCLPDYFCPVSSKKTTSAPAKRHEKRQMERWKMSLPQSSVVLKSLILRMPRIIVRETLLT